MADLCTLAEGKAHLNIPTATTTHDAEIAEFITIASNLIEEEAGRNYSGATLTEYHDGGTADVVLFQSPVGSVTSVTANGTLVASTLYRVYTATGLIHLTEGTFAGSQGQVVVVYVTTSTVPPLVKQATRETLRHLWQTQRGSMSGRNPLSGDGAAAGSTFSLPNRVVELIARLSMHGGIG